MKKLFETQESYYPNHYPEANEFMQAIWNGFWTHLEFDWNSDRLQFHNTLKPIEQQIVKRCLLAISQIEVSVKTFWADLGKHLPQPVFSDLGFVLAGNEVVHAKAYSNLLLILGLEGEFKTVLSENTDLKRRHKWLKEFTRKQFPLDDEEKQRKQFVYSLILFTLFTENTTLFSQFYILTHLHRYKNYLPKVNQQLDYTIKEEQLHTSVGIWLINTIHSQYPELFEDRDMMTKLNQFPANALRNDKKLISWILKDYENDNLTPDMVYSYICRRMEKAIEKLTIPLNVSLDYDRSLLPATEWMDTDSESMAMTDFFHKRPVGYTRQIDWSDLDF